MTITSDYQNQMRQKHDSSASWGNSAKNYGGADVVGVLDRYPMIKTVLDFGCGKCTMKPYVMARLNRQDVRWTEYDPAISGKDDVPEGRFDMVLSCDVLEHIEPDELDETLGQIADWTNVLSYQNIACSPTGRTFAQGIHEGKDIHLIVEKPKWWLDRLNSSFGTDFELWEFRDCARRAKGGNYRERATVIHERTGNVITRARR